MITETLLWLTVIWTVLLAYYPIGLRRAPFWVHRAYLWMALLAGLTLPFLPTFVSLTATTAPLVERTDTLLPTLTKFAGPERISDVVNVNWLAASYTLGVVFFLARTLVQWNRLKRFHATGDRSTYAGFSVVHHPGVSTPFAAFGTIFLPPGLLEEPLRRVTLVHEAMHLRQRHHHDVLVLSLLTILLWFHPLLWLFSRLIGEVHEYQADAAAIEHIPRRTYGRQLLRAAQTASPLHFSSSPLTHRIHMLLQPTTRRVQFFHLAAPLVLLLALGLTCSDAIAQSSAPARAEHISAAGYPILHDVPADATPEAANRAFLEAVYQEIQYPAAARNAGIEGTIYLSMTIAPDGKSRDFEITPRAGTQLTDPAIVVVGYSEPKTAPTDGSLQDLVAEVRRIVLFLNKRGGFTYENSGYNVPVTYGLAVQFKLEE